jgi:hypothetical protein
LRARSAGQRRELAVTPGQPGTPAHLRTGRLTRCANRPSEQRVILRRRLGASVAGAPRGRGSASRRITRGLAVLLDVAASRPPTLSRPGKVARSLREPERDGHGPRTEPTRVSGRRGKPQINRLFCKPTCKPDAARQLETGETQPTEREVICPVRRGHRTRERLPETWETYVVWLITQRSRVQIPPPLPRPEALSRTEKGPSA